MAKMTDEHKAALAKGRRQARIVRNYLKALNKGRRRGPKTDEESLRSRIDEVQREIEKEDDPAYRVELIQKRIDYEKRLQDLEGEPDLEELETQFVEIARDYSERKGITYTAWREEGVPASTLRAAGVPRTRRTA